MLEAEKIFQERNLGNTKEDHRKLNEEIQENQNLMFLEQYKDEEESYAARRETRYENEENTLKGQNALGDNLEDQTASKLITDENQTNEEEDYTSLY